MGFSARLKSQDLWSESFDKVKNTVKVDAMEVSAVSVREDNGRSGGEGGGGGAGGGNSSRSWSLPRSVVWEAEFLGDVSVLVSLTTDKVAFKVCCVRTTQYRKDQNESARSEKLGVALEGHRQLRRKGDLVTYSANAIRCGEPEVPHTRRRQEVRR